MRKGAQVRQLTPANPIRVRSASWRGAPFQGHSDEGWQGESQRRSHLLLSYRSWARCDDRRAGGLCDRDVQRTITSRGETVTVPVDPTGPQRPPVQRFHFSLFTFHFSACACLEPTRTPPFQPPIPNPIRGVISKPVRSSQRGPAAPLGPSDGLDIVSVTR